MDANILGYLSAINQVDTFNQNTSASSSNPGSSWIQTNSWGTGVAPTLAGRVCDNTTVGAYPLANIAPFKGASGYQLARYRIIMPNGGSNIIFYDRLVDYGGASAIPTTAQNFSAQALTRYTNGIGNQLILEVYATSTGSSATTITVSYTNENSVSGRIATLAAPASWCTVPRIYNLSLQAGDQGVISVQSVTLGTTSTNAGDFGISIVRPVMIWSSGLGTTNGVCQVDYRDFTRIIANPVLPNACLFLSYITSTTATGTLALAHSLI